MDHYSARNASDPRRFKTRYEDDLSQDKSARTHASNNHVSSYVRSGEMQVNGVVRQSRSPSRHNGSSQANARESIDRVSQIIPSHTDTINLSKANGEEEKHNKTKSSASEGVFHDDTITEEPGSTTSHLSEAELIEQRRRRREAIKAKHRAQPTLLVQALEPRVSSAPSTPLLQTANDAGDAASRKSPSTRIQKCTNIMPFQAASFMQSPQTPGTDSALGSPRPFVIDSEEDMLKRPIDDQSAEEQGPSAADYDPSMDMQEDRRDLIKQETTMEHSETVQNSSSAVGQSKLDVDMFADEDDDMFADGPVAPKGKAQAKALDKSLLDNWDYPDGHIRVIIGELLDGKYAIKQQIGKGTFATVVRAEELSTGKSVAIKIACNNDTMHKAGTHEMDFLNILNNSDPEDKRHIIRLLAHFEHKGHLCLVFENLHADLRETLKKHGRNVGLNLVALRSFAYSIFQALLHMQRNEILHADLKPDNILISERMNQLKICDFGTASKLKDAEVTPYLVSRFYRAPEVMLGIPLNPAIDMWSVGCTLFELYTGRILFTGADNNQMLRSIQECRGKIPVRMLKKSTLADKHFDEFGNFISIERDRSTGQLSYRQPNLTKIAPKKDLRSRLLDSTPGDDSANNKQVRDFIDLLDKCLQLDPARRISPVDALKHSFVTQRTAGGVPEKKRTVIVPALAPSSIR